MPSAGRFSARQRIRKRAEFQRIQGSGRRVTTRHFVLLLVAREPTPEHPEARIGITVSRRAGNAVARNRAKRLIREAFRGTPSLWAPDIDVVVIARGPLGPVRLPEVIAEWEKAQKALLRQIEEARRERDAHKDRLAETR